MVVIFSYLDENEEVKVSLVNKQWFHVTNNEIRNVSIKWPLQRNQDVQNLMNRFSKLKNIDIEYRGGGDDDAEHYAFSVAEAIFVGWFTFEYVIRFVAAPQKWR